MAHSLPPASLAIDHSSLATCHSPLLPRQESFASLHILTRRASEGSEALPSLARRVRMSFFGARVIFQAVSVRSIWGEPGRTANRQAFPSSPYPAISHSLQDRQIERISFRVSTNTHRAPLRGLSKARAFTSYRIGKDHPHDPDILPRQESFASLHIRTRRASEGSEALPSLARWVRMSFFGARVILSLRHDCPTLEAVSGK